MTALFDAVKPETFITLTGIALILLYLIVGNFRGWYIPGPTHRREIASLEAQVERARKDRDEQVKAIRDEMNDRMGNFRADHATRMMEARADHEKQLEALVKVADGIRADFASVLASKDRDIDQWRGAWHLTDQAGREEYAAQVDELVAGFRTIQRWLAEWQRQTGVPELRRAVEDRDAR